MKMSTHCILSKAFLPWAEGKFSIMSHVRDSFPSWRAHFLLTEHWHLRSVSFVFGFLAPWFHSKEKTMWRALLDSGPGHTVSHPSYCVFVSLIFKLHFTFPMGRVLRDPLPWKQGLRRKAVISNYTSGFYHPSNYWVRRMRGKTEGKGEKGIAKWASAMTGGDRWGADPSGTCPVKRSPLSNTKGRPLHSTCPESQNRAEGDVTVILRKPSCVKKQFFTENIYVFREVSRVSGGQ